MNCVDKDLYDEIQTIFCVNDRDASAFKIVQLFRSRLSEYVKKPSEDEIYSVMQGLLYYFHEGLDGEKGAEILDGFVKDMVKLLESK